MFILLFSVDVICMCVLARDEMRVMSRVMPRLKERKVKK